VGVLNPLFLLAAAAVAVPLYLHLARRSTTRRRPFPALRYLRRTERDHASRIRLRQLLLLALRCTVLLLLVLAGARLFLTEAGENHEPTAVAIVLDNSLSSGVVVDGERILDDLKRRALETVDRAGPEDRIWVIRAADPWDVPRPADPATLRDRIEETEPSGGAASLPRAVADARALVAGAGLTGAEVHLLTDGQATALEGENEAGAVGHDRATLPPVLAYIPDTEPPPNRWISEIELGGGLPPLVNQATEAGIRVDADTPPSTREEGEGGGETAPIRARVVLEDRVVAAVDVEPGAVALVPLGPFGPGWIQGLVELDPDALRADDRRHFAAAVRPAPRVLVRGEPGRFVREALEVLREAERIREASPETATLLLASDGVGIDDGTGSATVVLPPDDPALLPAANRRLGEAGIPWRYAVDPGRGETDLRPEDLPLPLEAVVVHRAYLLEPVGEGAERARVRVRRNSGEPWLVTDGEAQLPYLLLASPLNPDATTLPLRTEMLPFVEWIVTGWARGEGTGREGTAGEPLPVPEGATTVVLPDGTRHPVDGTDAFERTSTPGIYEVLREDSLLTRLAVVPPPRESRLGRSDPAVLASRIGEPAWTTDDARAWSEEIFLERRGDEVWEPLLGAALILLLLEGLVVPTGGPRASSGRDPERERGTVTAGGGRARVRE